MHLYGFSSVTGFNSGAGGASGAGGVTLLNVNSGAMGISGTGRVTTPELEVRTITETVRVNPVTNGGMRGVAGLDLIDKSKGSIVSNCNVQAEVGGVIIRNLITLRYVIFT